MRILVVNWQDWTHPQAGGAEIHLRETFGRLAGRGHAIDLLCVGHDGAPGEERLEGINVIRRGGSRATFNFAVPRAWRAFLSRNAYDVVQSSTPDPLGLWARGLARRQGSPFVALYHTALGQYAEIRGRRDDATECYRRILALPPADAGSYRVGSTLRRRGSTRKYSRSTSRLITTNTRAIRQR